jgi:hypothetical protein
MHWIFEEKELHEIPEGAVGFVYKIQCALSGRSYIGKKLLHSSRSRMVKLKSDNKRKKKQRYKVESDWKTYYGSSEELQTDIIAFGKENFHREILRICYSKGEVSYYEAKYQFSLGVLEYPELWYNRWISVRVRGIHLKNMKRDLTISEH